jgi:hypothetical protein
MFTVSTELALDGSLRITEKASESIFEAATPVMRLPKLNETKLKSLELVSFQDGASTIVPLTCKVRLTSVAKVILDVNDTKSKR